MSGPLEQIVTTVTQNQSLLTTTGIAGAAGLALRPAARALIDRCSEWVGVKIHAAEIVANAHAEGKAEIIKARNAVEVEKIKKIGAIDISAEEERALELYVRKATREQRNIDAVVIKASRGVSEDAKPEDIDEDWLNNFFDRGRLISNPEMQTLWGKVLSGEANAPGSYSRRMVSILQCLEKKDAENFQSLCCFSVLLEEESIPIIYNFREDIYAKEGISFGVLYELQSIGLIIFSPDTPTVVTTEDYIVRADYFGYEFLVDVSDSNKNFFNIGDVMLTQLGKEISKVMELKPVDGFDVFVKLQWESMDYRVDPRK